MSAPDLTLVTDIGVSIDTDRPILIPEGEYDFLLTNIWKGYMYGGRAPKVFLTFRIMTEGPYYGQHLKRLAGSLMVTSAVRGRCRKDPRTRAEVMSLLHD